MRLRFTIFPLFAAGLIAAPASDWPAFRKDGTSRTGLSSLPTTWSDDQGIAWKSDLGGYGQSSPVVFAATVWVTSTSGSRKETLLIEGFALDSGKALTRFEAAASSEVEEVTDMISQGAPTPAVDADGVYAFFESGDLIALSPEGQERWRRSLTEEFGPFLGGHGIGSSPAQNADCLFVLIDHDGPSYLIAINKADGTTAWKADRDPRVSWTSPILLTTGGRELVVTSSHGFLDLYEASTGEHLGTLDGLEGNNVPSPTWTGNLLLIGSSAPQQSRAVTFHPASDRRDAITFETLWKAGSVTSSFGSPVSYQGMAFFVNRAGALQAVSLKDGSALWETRLPASTWATPIVAEDRVLFFCQDGSTVILTPTPEGPGEPIAQNRVSVPDGTRLYGVALAKDRILLRLGRELIAVGPEIPK